MADLKKRLAERKVGDKKRIEAIAQGLEEGTAEGAMFTKKYRKQIEEAKKLKKLKK